ncbi:hypothetical protein [Cellulomonas sp. KRMCY2]|uniref:hypothetical protein n=1 Tax=Cellulomonas sp. KRMCY2 TaxID=1304865 RepID=UPI0004B4B51B|nr:hypothetical protein [Cellulomonas sp. KRMCY2]
MTVAKSTAADRDEVTERELRRMVLLQQRAAPRHTPSQVIDLALRMRSREEPQDGPPRR